MIDDLDLVKLLHVGKGMSLKVKEGPKDFLRRNLDVFA